MADDLAALLKSDLKALAKEKSGLYNRLRSIWDDITFVENICRQHYPHLPVAPNLRCGAWYVNPEWQHYVPTPTYFKSTDGHFNIWDFNIRRANLHLLPLIEQSGGIIIVDSTRRGKRFPDALSKTIPIWCSVINRALALEHNLPPSFERDLHTSDSVVSRSEHSQIEHKLDGLVQKLSQSAFEITLISKPLRPIWVSPASSAPPALDGKLDFFPVICLSASEHVQDGIERRNGYCYVQGSGDDHESWSKGLTPGMFWENIEEIRRSTEDSVYSVIQDIIARSLQVSCIPKSSSVASCNTPISKARPLVCLGNSVNASVPTILISSSIDLAEPHSSSPSLSTTVESLLFLLSIPAGKAGQLKFMSSIPGAINFAKTHLDRGTPLHIVSTEAPSLDGAIGMTMAILQALFDDNGLYTGQHQDSAASKQSIRSRLQWIQQSCLGVNPSRVTMNRVNEYFLSPPAMRSSLR